MIPLKPDTLSLYFGRAVRKLKLRPIKLHGLRHYSASVMHYLGIPTQYAMERGGWANERTLQDIYNGALEDKKDAFADAISDYFEQICNTKCNTPPIPAATGNGRQQRK